MASLVIPLIGLATSVLAISIEHSLQALTWKHNNTDFWAPVHLKSPVYYQQSPRGAAPSSLSRQLGGQKTSGYVGCTIATLQGDATSLSADFLEGVVSSYASDDVWTAGQFIGCLYVQYNGSSTSVPVYESVATFISKYGVETVLMAAAFDVKDIGSTVHVSLVVSSCLQSNGPYIATLPSCDGEGLGFTAVYTVHADNYEAFMKGSIPDSSPAGKHQQLHLPPPGARLAHIITPPRLSSTDARAGPLAGLRFAVKDIFHVTGLKTSGGSTAYYQTYGYQNYTTQTVQLTVDAGASLIGKTKTMAFALGAPRNGMEVDYPDPWSPRGDGYQNVSAPDYCLESYRETPQKHNKNPETPPS